MKEIADFTTASRSMAPQAAGARWLTFYDRFNKGRNFGQLSQLVYALPAPESWNDIAAGLKSRMKAKKGIEAESTRLFSEILAGNVPGQWQSMDYQLAHRNQGQNGGYMAAQILSAYRLLAERTGDQPRLLKAITLSMTEKGDQDNDSDVVIPDLVRTMGAAAAEKFLVTVLTTSIHPLLVNEGAQTRSMVHRLARVNIKRLRVAQWGLADLKRPPALYEAMASRFGAGGQSPEAKQARYLYVFNLYRDGRRVEAVKVARTIPKVSDYPGRFGAESEIDEMATTHAFTAFMGKLSGRPLLRHSGIST